MPAAPPQPLDDESDSMVKIERIRDSRAVRGVGKRSESAQIDSVVAAHTASVHAVQKIADNATNSELNRVATAVLRRETDTGAVPAAPLRNVPTLLQCPAPGETTDRLFAGDKELPETIMDDYAAAKRHGRLAAANECGVTGTTTLDTSAGMRITQNINKRVRELYEYDNSLVQEVSGEEDQNGFATMLPHAIPQAQNPFHFAFVRAHLERCPDDAVQACLTPDLEHTIRNLLTVNRREHEERMLRTPSENELPCVAASECMGRHIMCVGGGEVLMAFFSEEEWITYQVELQRHRDGLQDMPQPPNANTRCLLCQRADAATHVMHCRMRGVQFRVTRYDEKGRVRKNFVPAQMSKYCNLVNTPGEYRLEDCFGPSTEGYRGIVAPIVRADLVAFERYEDKTTNTVRFRQLLPYPTDEADDSDDSDGGVTDVPKSGF